MFSRKPFSSSFAPTKGLLLHSRRPAARASSMGAAEASEGLVRRVQSKVYCCCCYHCYYGLGHRC